MMFIAENATTVKTQGHAGTSRQTLDHHSQTDLDFVDIVDGLIELHRLLGLHTR